MRQWLCGLQFLRKCTPSRTRHNIEQTIRLGTCSRDILHGSGKRIARTVSGLPTEVNFAFTSARRRRCPGWAAVKGCGIDPGPSTPPMSAAGG